MLEMSQIQSVVHALGWTLIHFLWQGVAIASAYWLLCRLTPQRHAAVRYWSGMFAFLAAAVFPAATFLYYWQSSSGPVTASLFAAPLAPVTGNMSVTVTQAISFSLEPAIPAVVALWALGVSILTARAGMGWVGALRLVRLDTEEISGTVMTVVEKLKDQLGIRQAVRVLESRRVHVPTVVGWIKPVILLPAAVLSKLPGEQLEMVIAHELGHIRRFDYLFNLLQLVIETLFFYHPGIRWMSRQVRQEREHCCDDLVVARCGHPVLYAKALANLEVLRDPLPLVAMAANGGDLLHRVRRIVQMEKPGRQTGFAQMFTMLAVAGLVSVAAVQGLEMRQRLAEDPADFSARLAGSPSSFTQERRAWVAGISEFAAMNTAGNATVEDEAEPLLEIEASVVTPEPGPETQATNVPDQLADSETAVFAGPELESDTEAETSVAVTVETASAEELFAPPPVLRVDEEELLLASIEKLNPEGAGSKPPVEKMLEQKKEQFKITAETVVAPVYPFKARRKRIEGYVRLEFSVNHKGRPENILVVEAQPAEMFEKAAINALEKWRFKAGEGITSSKRLYQTFDFGMEEAGEILPKKERRCEITGSRICGLERYNEKSNSGSNP